MSPKRTIPATSTPASGAPTTRREGEGVPEAVVPAPRRRSDRGSRSPQQVAGRWLAARRERIPLEDGTFGVVTQEVLAGALRTSPPNLSLYERGHRGMGLRVLLKLRAALMLDGIEFLWLCHMTAGLEPPKELANALARGDYVHIEDLNW